MLVEAIQTAMSGDQWWVEATDTGYALHINPAALDTVLLFAIRCLTGPATLLWTVESSDPDDMDWDVWSLAPEGHELVTVLNYRLGSSCVTPKSDPSLDHAHRRYSPIAPELQSVGSASSVWRELPARTHRSGSFPA